MSSQQPAKRSSSALTCSVCGSRFFPDETSAPPFCSERCKMIDLGRWLDEEIGVPHEGGPTRGEITEHDDSAPHESGGSGLGGRSERDRGDL